MKKKIISMLLCLSMGAAMLSGCGNTKEEETKKEVEYKDTIVYSLDGTFRGVYLPVLGMSDYDGSISEVLYPSLFVPEQSGELEAYLSDGDCEISEDGVTYTYKIRKDAVWSDGEKVTAEDVAFTFRLLADPTNTDEFASGIKHVKGVEEYQAGTAEDVEGINIVDEYTVEFTLTEPYAKFASYVGEMGIMPEHVWGEYRFEELESADRDILTNHPVVCGPYTVEECVDGEYVHLVANEEFFLGKPVTENFFFKVINADSIAAELTSGAVDIAAVTNLTSAEIDELDNDGFDVTYFYYDLFQCMQFNTDRNFSKDFKKAVAYAIDRDSMVEDLMEGRGVVCNLVMSAASWGYPTEVKGVSQDLDKAKEYLEAAGYKDINGDGFVEDPDGNEVVLSLLYPQGLVVREQSAVVIQDNLKQIGINVELNCHDFATLAKLAFNEKAYDLLLMGYGVDSTDPDPTNFVKASYGFPQEAIDLTAEAVATTDKEARKEMYAELAEIQQEEVPLITLYCQEKAYAYPEKMINYEAGTYSNFRNVHLWAIEK